MDNRVGDDIPTPQQLAELLKKLNDVISELHKFCVVLSKDERRSLLRGRKDSEPMVQKIYDICKKHNVTVPGIPLEGMLNDMRLVQAARPFEAAFELGARMADDTGAQADTEMWQAFLTHYGVLQTMSARNPEIAEELKPVVEFMRARRRAPAPPPEPPPEDR